MASWMQIGQETQQTERAHQEGFSVLNLRQFLGTAGNKDPWHSVQQKQNTWQQASQAACEAIWMRKILVGLFSSHLDPTVVHCDNQSCIKILINLVFHDRSKHIDLQYHHIRDCVQ